MSKCQLFGDKKRETTKIKDQIKKAINEMQQATDLCKMVGKIPCCISKNGLCSTLALGTCLSYRNHSGLPYGLQSCLESLQHPSTPPVPELAMGSVEGTA